MSLSNGIGVRIIVSEPYEWAYGNLFGTVISSKGNKILIKLSKPIVGNKWESDLLEVSPRYQGESFKPLEQYYSVTIGGALRKENSDEFDYILIGTITID
jgi:hypothetical protein